MEAKEIKELDAILAGFEDWMHGQDGDDVTKARKILQSLQQENRDRELNILSNGDVVVVGKGLVVGNADKVVERMDKVQQENERLKELCSDIRQLAKENIESLEAQIKELKELFGSMYLDSRCPIPDEYLERAEKLGIIGH